jgi:signal transduction histidine kinase/DNA-binding NarL/FixJ family response regulator
MRERKAPFSYKIALLLFFGIVTILGSGYFSYQSLSSVVRLMQNEYTPDNKFFAIKNITTSIEKAENSIRLYGITKKDKHLERYRKTLPEIDSNFSNLKHQYAKDQWFSSKIDTISTLLDIKKKLWGEIILLWESDNTGEEFSNLTKKLTTNNQDAEKKKNLFDRLFNSQKDDQKINKQEILDKLNDIESIEKEIEESLFKKETELTLSSNLISEAFISLFEQLDNYEKEKNIQLYKKADQLAQKSYLLLAIFSLSGIILSGIILFLIIKYSRKNRAYNDILINSRLETERLAKSKELFMAKVSHEIRTPLNAISGFIKQVLTMPLESQIKDKIKIVDLASDQLIRLINDVLDFTKLQSHKLSVNNTHFEPVVVIENVCRLFSELAKKKGNTLTYKVKNNDNIILCGDVLRLQQILYNLLSNAVKFTENGDIEVLANISKESEENVLFELIIEDNGYGIDSSRLEDVFQEYTQENQDISMHYTGTGLGLAIVKKLVELFNGDVKLESKKGVGTKVVCNLRFAAGDKNKIKIKIDSAKEYVFPPDLNILLADDEEYNRLLITSTLDKWNITYDIAINGLEAIELLKKKAYHVVLMDIRMPVINGEMATKFIRETLKLSSQQTKVIGVTADISTNIDSKTKKLFDDLLTKPFSEDELYQAITLNLDEPTNKNTNAIDEQERDSKEDADLSNLIRSAAKDLDFIQEMILQFKDSSKKGLKEIRMATKNNQFDTVANAAHKLIPAARHLGAQKLVSLLKKIEENAISENKNVILEILPETEETARNAVQSLKTQFKDLKEQ